MGNEPNNTNDSKLICEKFEAKTIRKNEIDKKKYKNINIDNIFAENALKANNKFRTSHGVNILELDNYLNKRAFILAQEFLTKRKFENENLLYKNGDDLGMNVKLSNNKLEAEELMENWYEENKKYNYEAPKELECNNFTQMIWKDSIKLGIGYYHLNENDRKITAKKIDNIKEDKEDKNLIEFEFCYIALYYPAGNKPEEYEFNVKKLKNSIQSEANDMIEEINILSDEQNPPEDIKINEEYGLQNFDDNINIYSDIREDET